MCSGDTRPSVLWENLTALQPVTLEEAKIALFLRKLPRHISALINTRSFNTTEGMIQRCNALWMSRTPEEAASAAAAAEAARGSTLLSGTPTDPPPRTDARRPAATSRAAAARPPLGQPRAAATTVFVSRLAPLWGSLFQY
jgi:hypothetical protein